MGKIANDLEDHLRAAEPTNQTKVIVHLGPGEDWPTMVERVKGLGFAESTEAPEIRVISGRASGETIRRIADLPGVRLIERDQTATAQ